MANSCLRREASTRTVYLFATIVFLFFFLHFAEKHHIFNSIPSIPTRRLEESRPLIFTYFDAPTEYNPDDASVDLLDNWKKAWFDVGWQPRVISDNDARLLPDYQELIGLLTSESLIAPDAVLEYKRWLAMAAAGGGWMADINTFPLNYFIRHGRTLPNDGVLTIYGVTIPALISGTGNEYLRIAKQIGATFEKHVGNQKMLNENFPEKYKKRVDWNVKKALDEMRKKSKDMFKSRNEVWAAKKELMTNIWTPEECQLTDGKRVVQFGFINLKTKEGGTAARKFINMWRNTCPNTQVAEIDVAR
jgi:hypothetical protein